MTSGGYSGLFSIMSGPSIIRRVAAFVQIALFVIVMELCENQSRCSVQAQSRTFGEDQCPGTSKYLDVAYQCRPDEFLSETICEGAELDLQCSQKNKLVIHSAMFGRSTTILSQCPTPTRHAGLDCSSQCAFEIVSRQCRGRKRCTVEASIDHFGNPCAANVPKYLNVIYACVPRRILRELATNENEEDSTSNSFCDDENGTDGNEAESLRTTPLMPHLPEMDDSDGDSPLDASYPSEVDRNLEDEFAPFDRLFPESPTTTLPTNVEETEPECSEYDVDCDRNAETMPIQSPPDYMGFLTDWIYTVKFIDDHIEKFILYFILGLAFGLICLLLLIIGLLVRQRKRDQQNLNLSEPVPNSSGRTENLSLLEPSEPYGVEILSMNHHNPHNHGPPFHTDTGRRSINNYYG